MAEKTEGKRKFALWIEESTLAQVRKWYKADNCSSQSEFIDKLFCELIDRLILQSNTKIRFRLKNGLELPESIERTVR